MNPLRRVRASEILEGVSRLRVAVFGDFMLDRYVWGEASRISPEAPIPILRFRRESHRVGGAANVARNLAALGASVVPVGVIGKDPGGDRLRRCLAEEGIPVDGLLEVPGRCTTVKTRFLAGHHPVARLDLEEDLPVSEPIAQRLLGFCREALGSVQGLILSDYEKGVVTETTSSGLMAAAGQREVPVFVDPKTSHFSRFLGARLVTPNLAEARIATGRVPDRDEEDLEGLGKDLLGILQCQGLLVTRGEKGMVLFEPGRKSVEIPATAREVFDVTGAGDTVISVAALGVLAGADLVEASQLSNWAAGKVVGKLGTAAISRQEILEGLE